MFNSGTRRAVSGLKSTGAVVSNPGARRRALWRFRCKTITYPEKAESFGDYFGRRRDGQAHGLATLMGMPVSMVWASKPSAVSCFPVLAAKPRADLARSRSGRRARGIISELTSRRREVEEEPCPSDASTKIWTVLPLRGWLS